MFDGDNDAEASLNAVGSSAEREISLGKIDYSEQGKEVSIVTQNLNFLESTSYQVIRFDLEGKTNADHFYLKNKEGADNNASGVISIDDSDNVYRGNGGGRDKIGRVIGQGTKDLKIEFSIDKKFVNHDFEAPMGPMGSTGEGWLIPDKDVVLPVRFEGDMGQVTTVFGHSVPVPESYEPGPHNPPMDAPFKRNTQWTIERERSLQGTTGNNALNIASKNIRLYSDNKIDIYGPYAASNQLTLLKGENFSFEWRIDTVAPGDKGMTIFYLLDQGTGRKILIDEKSAKELEDPREDVPDRDTWHRWQITIPETGNYRFIAFVGVKDVSNQRSSGASLKLDNLNVELPGKAQLLNDIVQQVRYKNDAGEQTPGSRKITVSAGSDGSGSKVVLGSGMIDVPFPPLPSSGPGQLWQTVGVHPSSPADAGGSPRHSTISEPLFHVPDHSFLNDLIGLGNKLPEPLPDNKDSRFLLPTLPVTFTDSRSIELSDGFTRGNGASTPIAIASGDRPSYYGPGGTGISVTGHIEDVPLGYGQFSFQLPRDIFTHTNPGVLVELEATRMDGTDLPKWIQFDSMGLIFSGKIPAGLKERFITIKVTATTYDGTDRGTAYTTFDLHLIDDEKNIDSAKQKHYSAPYHGDDNIAPGTERLAFSTQLAMAGQAGFKIRQEAFIATINGNG